MKRRHIRNSFVKAVIIDKDTGTVPVLDKLIGTCRRWKSCSKDIGVAKKGKNHCRKQFQTLMQIQFKEGQVSYPHMHAVGILKGEHVNINVHT